MINKMNFVIVNYNNSQCTLDLIESLEVNRDFVNEIVVVDNASSREELRLLESIQTSLNIKILNLSRNLGYFQGLNCGLEILECKINYPTFIGNNDLIFSSNFFDIFFRSNYSDKVLAVAPSFKTKDGVYQNPAQPMKPSKFKRVFYSLYFSNYALGVLLYKLWSVIGLSANSRLSKDLTSRVIYIGMGAGYIILPGFFSVYNDLIYPGFLYGEEAFFSKQIEDAGGVLFYNAELDILHLESVATNKLPSKDKYKMMKKSYMIYKDYFNR